jgi:NADH:ubiquinone oxidoreductase subunit K
MSAPGERPDGPAPAAPEPTGAQAAAPLTFDRHLVIEQLGGWRGMVDASLPTIAFIVANSLGGLRTGIWAALGVALVVFVLRLVRRESVQQAFSGLIAVGVAVAIAASSGQARDFFVLGILRNAGLGAVLLASIPFRRPLVGVIAEFLAPSHLGSLADHSLPGLRRWDRSQAPLRPGAGETDPSTGVRDPDPEPDCHWRDDPRMLRAYNWLTVLWGAVFLVRAVVQWLLYLQDAVTALGTVSVILGLPVTAAEVVVTLWVVARLHRHRSADRRADDGPTAPGD